MKRLARRRWRQITITAIISTLVVLVWWGSQATLNGATSIFGWLLAGLIVFLACYNLRKKLPFVPLGSSSGWFQLHIYVGWLTVVLFGAHIGLRLPNGGLETLLAILYAAVTASGIFGLVWSRLSAPRLSRRGDGVLFERIPARYRQVREQAERLAIQSVEQSDASTIADFHSATLMPFFAGPSHMLAHFFGSNRARHRLLRRLDALSRYLDEQEQSILDQLADLVRIKDDLDFHRAVQGSLKGWLFIHIPLSYSLLLVGIAHVLVVYRFGGSG